MKEAAPINKTFTSEIGVHENGWMCVRWPESVAYFGSTKAVKVRGTMRASSSRLRFCQQAMARSFYLLIKN